MYTGQVFVTLKKAVLDPQGDTVKRSLHTMGYPEVKDVRVGKHIVVKLEGATRQEAKERLDEMCRQLLANPVIEEFHIEIVEDDQ